MARYSTQQVGSYDKNKKVEPTTPQPAPVAVQPTPVSGNKTNRIGMAAPEELQQKWLQQKLAEKNGGGTGTGTGTNQIPAEAYGGLEGLSRTTATNLGSAQGGYQQSSAAAAAQQQLEALQAQKPQGYTSKYGASLDNILQQIQNPQEFKYEFNGDNLFNAYKDMYTQLGKQASMDAMGQAAGLTGGYGNSYAQMAGQQAYQQNLGQLYDRGMELYDRAYQRNRDLNSDLKDAYSMLSSADDTAYGRYRDTLGDWKDERDYLANRYDTEEERAYARHKDDLNYWTQLAQVENADYRSEQERQEAIRQFNAEYDEKQRQFNENLAEQQRQYDTDNAYRYDVFNYGKESDAADNLFRQQQFEYQQEQDKLAQDNWLKNFDWQTYQDQRDFEYKAQQDAADNLYRQQQFEESIRQFNAGLDFDKMTNDQKYAASWVEQMLANGQMPSEEMLKAAGLSAEDAQKLMAQVAQIPQTINVTVNPSVTGPSYVPSPDTYTKGDTSGGMTYLDANKKTMVSNPDNQSAAEKAYAIAKDNTVLPSAEAAAAAGISAQEAWNNYLNNIVVPGVKQPKKKTGGT